jgi:pimeloyl-ACP methyl ester carboxylesterase
MNGVGCWAREVVMAVRVLLLPGAVMPAALAYEALLAELGPDLEAVTRELELYRNDTPPADYSLATEVNGVRAEADRLGWDRLHLVGYSAGGSVALAYAARDPGRLLSLALLEPAWAGDWGWSPAHRRLWESYREIEQLPPDESMPAFMRLQVRPAIDLPAPPSGPAPPWMARRPAGIRALLRTFRDYQLDRAALAAFDAPVYFALGGRSNPDQFAEEADRLAEVFPDFTLEVFQERHHFDPPHRIEPARLAASLRDLWSRAEAAVL